MLKTKPWRNFIAYTEICSKHGTEIREMAFLSAYQVSRKMTKKEREFGQKASLRIGKYKVSSKLEKTKNVCFLRINGILRE